MCIASMSWRRRRSMHRPFTFGDVLGLEVRPRWEKLRCGTLSLVGWPDAAYGGQVDGRKVPMGHM